MKPAEAASLLAVLGLLFLLASFATVTEAVTCNPVELSPCLPSFTSPAPPTAQCCSKLREQEPCFCQYIHNPAFAPYINGPQAKKVMNVCRIPYPKC